VYNKVAPVKIECRARKLRCKTNILNSKIRTQNLCEKYVATQLKAANLKERLRTTEISVKTNISMNNTKTGTLKKGKTNEVKRKYIKLYIKGSIKHPALTRKGRNRSKILQVKF
jgi:hypothetical protein